MEEKGKEENFGVHSSVLLFRLFQAKLHALATPSQFNGDKLQPRNKDGILLRVAANIDRHNRNTEGGER